MLTSELIFLSPADGWLWSTAQESGPEEQGPDVGAELQKLYARGRLSPNAIGDDVSACMH
jgi:hypothetical protein